MPNTVHETLAGFASHIKDQLHDSGFLAPLGLGKDAWIMKGNAAVSLQVGRTRWLVQPDAAIAIFRPQNTPFLVVEVAVSQSEREALRKASHYLIGSGGQVTFVLLVVVERVEAVQRGATVQRDDAVQTDNAAQTDDAIQTDDAVQTDDVIQTDDRRSLDITTSTLSQTPTDLSDWSVRDQLADIVQDQQSSHSRKNTETEVEQHQQEETVIRLLSRTELLSEGDRVLVSVYRKTEAAVPNNPNLVHRSGVALVSRLEVYPAQPPPHQAFPIRWSDVSTLPWASVVRNRNLAPDTPEPACDIDISSLALLARDAASQGLPFADDPLYSGNVRDTREAVAISFIPSSSPAVHLESDATVPSDEDRRRDPDFESVSTPSSFST